jgi:nicotinate-nucleotide pyrophosphorylase (carboxylating)
MNDFESLLAELAMPDPFYEKVLGECRNRRLTAVLRSQGEGRLAGVPMAQHAAKALGIEGDWKKRTGEDVRKGEAVARFQGLAEPILKLENLVIGIIAKPSGIATAAAKAVHAADGRVRLVSGGWKKHPVLIKEMVREAVAAGGFGQRILDQPFLYLDKNYVRIFGGIGQTLRAVAADRAAKVIQVRGEFAPIAEEAREAIRNGAGVVMVDTGSWEDLDKVLQVMKAGKPSSGVQTAFAGGIRIEDIPALVRKGVDILDIGAAILDAPWLELSYDVVKER